MYNFKIPLRPWQRICIDYMHIKLINAPYGYKYLLIAVDQFTKYLLIMPTRDMTAITTAQVINDRLFAPLGIPEEIRSDNAKYFTSTYMAEINRIFKIKHIPSVANAPHTNGQVERYVGVVTHSLQTLMKTYQGKPEQFLDAIATIASVTNATPNRMTGESPFYMLFLRRPRSVISEIQRLLIVAPDDVTNYEARDNVRIYLQQAIQLQRELHISAIHKLRRTRNKMITDYNRNQKEFKPIIGELVMFNFNKARHKRDLDPLFTDRSLGPYMIIGTTPNTLFCCDWTGKPYRTPVHVRHAIRTQARDDKLFDDARKRYIPLDTVEQDTDDNSDELSQNNLMPSPTLVDTIYPEFAYSPLAKELITPIPSDMSACDTVEDLRKAHEAYSELPTDDTNWDQL
jgi:transposase InsO family protein